MRTAVGAHIYEHTCIHVSYTGIYASRISSISSNIAYTATHIHSMYVSLILVCMRPILLYSSSYYCMCVHILFGDEFATFLPHRIRICVLILIHVSACAMCSHADKFVSSYYCIRVLILPDIYLSILNIYVYICIYIYIYI